MQANDNERGMMQVLALSAESLGLALTPTQIQQFETYYRELVDWNQKFNLTSVTGYEEVQARHFADSLALIPVLRDISPTMLASARAVDVGAGAGLPGIPLAIALPSLEVTLIESTGKKATFMRHVAQTLGLQSVKVMVGRAEDLAHKPDLRERFDLGLARGVAALPALVELVLPFLRIGGFLAAHKGAAVDEEVRAAKTAIRVLGGRLREVRKVEIDRILSPSTFVIIEKITKTPASYPRKPGLPAKRPL